MQLTPLSTHRAPRKKNKRRVHSFSDMVYINCIDIFIVTGSNSNNFNTFKICETKYYLETGYILSENRRKCYRHILCELSNYVVGQDSSVGIVTRYGLDGPGIKSRWGRDFPRPSRLSLGPTQPHIQWVPGLFPGYSGQGVALITPPI